MRVRHRRDERGAVLIVVAAFVLVAVIFLAFVVDIGNQRQNRRQLATATDATSLDVAQEWANKDFSATAAGFSVVSATKWDCTTAALATLKANNDGVDIPASSVSCVAEDKGGWGIVTVATGEKVDYQVGQVIGVSEGDTRSTTSVRLSTRTAGGLRPFALCGSRSDLKDWIASGASDDLTIDAAKFLTEECGNAVGNWGLLDLDGNGAKTVGNMWTKGYSGDVAVSPDPNVCSVTSPPSCFTGSTGNKFNSTNITDALDYLEGPPGCAQGGVEFMLPLYNKVVDPQGKNASYPITGFARVQLMCYEVGNGNPDLTKLELKFFEYDPDGNCCGITSTNRRLEVCDVGTIGGALGPKFTSTCSAPTWSPPTVGDGCVVNPISPTTRDVPVETDGRPKDPVSVLVTADDLANCPDLSLRARPSSGSAITAGDPSVSGNTLTFVFSTSEVLSSSETTFTLEVFDDDAFIWDDTATMTTKPGSVAACGVNSASVTPNSVDGSGNALGVAVVVSVQLENWTNCPALTVELVGTLPSGSQTNPVITNELPTSATMTRTLPAGSKTYGNGGASFTVVVKSATQTFTYASPAVLTIT